MKETHLVSRYIMLIVGLSILIRIACIMSNNLLVEEAYYWNYAQHLDFGYLDHPPMVALLIKISTYLFGTHEWSVRFTCLIGWLACMFFSYRLTELIKPGAGRYAILLQASLPFFFLQSVVITPDLPLLVGWSAALYYLYLAQVLKQNSAWYLAGMWLGFGMLSKYTIALLGFSIVGYLITTPAARYWFRRKEPYTAAFIAFLLFMPVIYWNATHHWISFFFQSSRRLSSLSYPHLPQFLGLLLLFITPMGLSGLWSLLTKKTVTTAIISAESMHFIRLFSLIPLGVFALFSVNHNIKFNWLGPIVLALVPLFASQMTHSVARCKWLVMTSILVGCYGIALLVISLSSSALIQQTLFKKFIDWEHLTQQFNTVAQTIELQTHKRPVFVPLDLYPIASELSFYQAKLAATGIISTRYPIVGGHIFGIDNLMYRYWTGQENLSGQTLILVTRQPRFFDSPIIKQRVIDVTDIKKIESKSQGQRIDSIPYFYKVVIMRNG